MGILLEIGLVIWAWKRGWKAWALLPFGLAFAAGLVLGFVQAFSGVMIEDVEVVYVIVDLAVLVVLISMIITGHKERENDPAALKDEGSVDDLVLQQR